MPKVARVIGTTEDSVSRAERELSRRLPPSFRRWILENNGRGLGSVHVYPVLDDRDPRKTWDSIVRNFKVGWEAWLEIFGTEREAFTALLPFADFDRWTTTVRLFKDRDNGEPVVVPGLMRPGNEPRGDSFEDPACRLKAGSSTMIEPLVPCRAGMTPNNQFQRRSTAAR
jgi:hypothetical protein